MPSIHEQHQAATAIPNPYDTEKRVQQYTAREIATLQSKLDKQLGPEYISNRQGAGGQRVYYVSGEKVITLANEVFGFNGWSSSIQNVQVDFCDQDRNSGRVSLGLSIIVRVTVKDGTYHEDIGYGQIENAKNKAAAFEKAKKEAATDALKRALRNFGNVLGNCLYDKEYLQKVNKVKAAPRGFDEENLHRHQLAPRKMENIPPVNHARQASNHPANQSPVKAEPDVAFEFEDEFGANGFDEGDFPNPDEVVMDDEWIESPQQDIQTASTRQTRQGPSNGNIISTHSGPTNPSTTNMPPPGFVPSRAAELLNHDGGLPASSPLPTFNPHAESPSIRRTSGVNHARSEPIFRKGVQSDGNTSTNGEAPIRNGTTAGADPRPGSINSTSNGGAANFVNPHQDPSRRIGVPLSGGGGMPSPLANRSAYKPPSVIGKRPALADLSNVPAAADTEALAVGDEAKKVKTETRVENDGPRGNVAA